MEEGLRKKVLQSRRILIIGPIDTGKSYTFRQIIELLKGKERFVALDSDVGQSSLGLPTTLNLEEYSLNGNLVKKSFFFYGFTSPRSYPFRFLTGFFKLLAPYVSRGIKIVVDTTGYVEPPYALYMKQQKAEFLQPDLILLFGRERLQPDWDWFIKLHKRKIIQVEVSPKVRSRNMNERARYRRERFTSYFEGAKEAAVPRNYLLPIKPGAEPKEGNLLCFRNRAGKDLFLGVIKQVGEQEVKVLIPADAEPTPYVLFSPYCYMTEEQQNAQD